MPTINVNGFRLIHPTFILIDTLRAYTDPLTSYFRLKKTSSTNDIGICGLAAEPSFIMV
jgi:hypothetical protein